MQVPHVRITATPPGEAPLWVREKWVGLVLPLAPGGSAPGTYLTSGVLSGPQTRLALLIALITKKLERQPKGSPRKLS